MAATTLLTSDQFLALPEEFDPDDTGIRQELICGEVIDVPPPSQKHDIICSNLVKALVAYELANKGRGLKALSNTSFVVSGSSVLIPDVSVVAISRLNPMDDKYIPGPPELAIEVVSPTDKAIQLKKKIDSYMANGSQSVWAVYPDARSIMVYRADSVRELKANQSIQDPLLPGFSSPVAAFFELT
jgi:Uma2 family endonuclease